MHVYRDSCFPSVKNVYRLRLVCTAASSYTDAADLRAHPSVIGYEQLRLIESNEKGANQSRRRGVGIKKVRKRCKRRPPNLADVPTSRSARSICSESDSSIYFFINRCVRMRAKHFQLLCRRPPRKHTCQLRANQKNRTKALCLRSVDNRFGFEVHRCVDEHQTESAR